MLTVLLPLAYFSIFLFLLRKFSLFSFPGISPILVQVLFTLKVLCGMFATWYGFTLLKGLDMTGFFYSGIHFHDLVYTNPVSFFRAFFGIEDAQTVDFLNSLGNWYSYTWDVSYNDNRIIIRLNALFAFFSMRNPYVHALFFCFLSFTGIALLVKVWVHQNTKVFAPVLLAGLCLLPGSLLWTSAIGKDSWALFLTGLLVYETHLLINRKGGALNAFALLATGLAFIFSKSYLLMLLLPALTAWALAVRYPVKRTGLLFTGVYLFFFLVIFLVGKLFPLYDAANIIFMRQHNFIQFSQHPAVRTTLPMIPLQQGYLSLFLALPEALFRSLTHPGISELGNTLLLPFYFENLFLLAAFLLTIFRTKTDWKNPLTWFSLAAGFSILFLMGLTVPVCGLLIRLRVPGILFLWYFLHAGPAALFSFQKKPMHTSA